MKKWTKSVLVTVLSAVFLLGCMGTAWAGTDDRDANSGFAKDVGTANDGITQFSLIKDYDSVHETASAPFSKSPAETFTYTITPFGVWNAGSTYSGTGAGTATTINTNNMPMLQTVSGTSVTSTYDSTNRTLVVKQSVNKSAALKETPDNNANDAKATFTLPDYTTVGDYWYQVVESKGENNDNRTTGVIYGTNDAISGDNDHSNFDHTGTYYLHVQVTQGASALIKNVTLHKNHPTTGWSNVDYNNARSNMYNTGNKVNAIENRYYAGQLQIVKVVDGSAGDKSQYFRVRVKFTKPAGTVINSDIEIKDAFYNTATSGSPTYATDDNKTIPGQYSNTTAPATGTLFKWDKAANDTTEATAVVEFYVTNGTTVNFYNIPLGINYTVEEYDTGDLGYTNVFANQGATDQLSRKFNGNNPDLEQDGNAATDVSHFCTENTTELGAWGSITGPNADVVTITNSKSMTIDIGVITENAPYIAMLAVSGAALFLLFLRKKNPSEV